MRQVERDLHFQLVQSSTECIVIYDACENIAQS